MAQPSHWFAEPDGTLVSVGCPNDGQDYQPIGPVDDVRGKRIVWFHHGHQWGYALSDPIPGAHLPNVQTKDWPLDKLALYWVYAVTDAGLPEYLADRDARVLVPIQHAWLVPQPPPPVSG